MLHPLELTALLLLAAFEGFVGGVAVILSLTYLSFIRMDKNVRRARMFIMADRIQRFLGAFTLGFVVLAVTFATSFLGPVIPAGVAIGAFFFFLAAMAYGIIELYFIVRPKRTLRSPNGTSWRPSFGKSATEQRVGPAEEEPDATR